MQRMHACYRVPPRSELRPGRRICRCTAPIEWLSACLVATTKFKKVLQYLSHQILRYVHGALNVDEKKTAQFGWKLRDECFEPH